jgi:predicted permease
VQAVAFTSLLPIQGGATDRYFAIDNAPLERDLSKVPDAEIRLVSSDYFRAMHIPLIAGREFDDHDTRASEHVVVINDELAHRYFPAGALGRRLTSGEAEGGRIVGVVKSVRQMALDQEPRAEFYLPVSQALYSTQEMTFVVRAQGRPEDLARAVREAVRGVAPQPVFQLATMDDVISRSLTTRRLVLVLLLAFAGLALLLSAAGVYGVMSYGVSQRTREIGIRVALGARGVDVLGMILAGAARVLAIGIGAGLFAAALLTRALDSILYGVGALDPLTFAAVPAVIAFVGIVAGAVPAARAARVDPLESMRAE